MRLLITLLLPLALAHAETYQFVPAPEARLALTVEKTGLYRGKHHLFLFEKYHGRLEFDEKQPEASKIELTIESASAVCKDDWVSAGDLKNIMQTTFDDMLAVKRYPNIVFTSTSIKPLGGNRYEAQGTLTIRDLPKPVTVTVAWDAPKPGQVRLTGKSTIRLTDYKLTPPSAMLGAIGTKDEMTLEFSLLATHVNE